MKCSAVRDTNKNGFQPCGQMAKFEFEGFCCLEHNEQAKKYAGSAYVKHVAHYKSFIGKKDVFRMFNEDFRPVFASVVEAGKKHEREQLLKTIGLEYATMAKSAWQTVDAVKNEVGQLLQVEVKEARDAVKNAKRVREHTALTDIMRRTVSSDDDKSLSSPNPVPKQKAKSGSPVSPRHIALPDASSDEDLMD